MEHYRGTPGLEAIARTLATALDDEREYLPEGEFTSYMRSYASDAAFELRSILQGTVPSEEELALCLGEICDERRMANGRSTQLLTALGDQARPLIEALARSDDASLRLFAVEVAGSGAEARFNYNPLCTLVGYVPELLDDSDETVRVAAARSANWMVMNRNYLVWYVASSPDDPVIH